MRDEILSHLHDAAELEKLYRSNKLPFRREFSTLYPDLKGNTLADFWYERFQHENDEINWGTRLEFLLVLAACLVAGVLAKLPSIVQIDEEFFYPRNIGFIIFPMLIAYFAWRNKISRGWIVFLLIANVVGLVFINALPGVEPVDTVILSCIHLALFLWSLLGVAYIGNENESVERRLSYLKFNGDLLVMTTIIMIAAGILTGITIGLFSIIGFNIEEFYFRNVVVFGLPAAPIIATWLIQTNPQLVGKVSPVIARIFSPLVLIMLTIYLGAMIFSGKDPYKDREFLLIFNGLLIGVMAIIFFSVAEQASRNRSVTESWVALLLSVLTIVVNSIALSAIAFRIAEWGITPNRVAVLGGNVLILVNLLSVTAQLFKVVSKRAGQVAVRKAIASYLPVYFVWTIIVTFIFPLIFGFR